MKVKFCGAAQSVTGSCHLITCGEHQILFDCGQFQGGKQQERQNYEDFPFDPAEIECVVLSHAHIDHCGRLPLLVKRGFKGKIYCTDATADLLDVMLKDSGYIHEKEAEWQNRKNERAGRPLVEPLYTFNDAAATLAYVVPVRYDQLIDLNDDMKLYSTRRATYSDPRSLSCSRRRMESRARSSSRETSASSEDRSSETRRSSRRPITSSWRRRTATGSIRKKETISTL